MKIKQTYGSYQLHRTGTLSNISIDEVTNALGFSPATFAPNYGDGKVMVQWQFEAILASDIPMAGSRKFPCAIWDYNGSLAIKELSVWMTDEVGKNLFGKKYSNEGKY
jgi:hypothetical protein